MTQVENYVLDITVPLKEQIDALEAKVATLTDVVDRLKQASGTKSGSRTTPTPADKRQYDARVLSMNVMGAPHTAAEARQELLRTAKAYCDAYGTKAKAVRYSQAHQAYIIDTGDSYFRSFITKPWTAELLLLLVKTNKNLSRRPGREHMDFMQWTDRPNTSLVLYL